MPLLTLFLLVAICLPVDWPESPLGFDRRASAAWTGVAVLVPLIMAFTLRTWVVVALRCDPRRRSEVGRGYVRIRTLLYYVNLAAVLAAVFAFGWGWTARQTFGLVSGEYLTYPGERPSPAFVPFGELLVPLPYFVILLGVWTIYYDAERALFRASTHNPVGRPFWSRAGYVLHHVRQTLLLLFLPVGLVVSQQSLSRAFPELTHTTAYHVISLVMTAAIVVLMPLVVKPLLGLRTMPPGPTRDRLTALARRLHFRFADLLVWPTGGGVMNAMVAGLVPRVRFVVFTDRMLEDMPADELDAVFGHEVGHARHGHIWYYAGFLALSLATLAAVMLYVEQRLLPRLTIPKEAETWLLLPPVALVVAYVFVVFGFLSRRCERQADIFGAWAVSCGDPACSGHDESTVFPHDHWRTCPTGLRTFAHALERVELLNGQYEHKRSVLRAAWEWVRTWQHATIPKRVAFLVSLIDNPARERRFQRRVAVLRWGLVLALAVTLLVFGELVGWNELVGSM